MPNSVGTGALRWPLWVLPLISFSIGIDLQRVVALDVLETVGPGAESAKDREWASSYARSGVVTPGRATTVELISGE